MKLRCRWLRAPRPAKSTQTYPQRRGLLTTKGTIESAGSESHTVPDAESQPASGVFWLPHGLPLSPVMDLAMRTGTVKYRDPKPPPNKRLNSVQIKLKNNPYAHALAAPVRCCAILKARLPSSFLICYRLIAHPETGALWYLPQGLAKRPPRSRNSANPNEQPSFSSPPDGPSSYTLSNASLLQHIAPVRKKRRSFTWELLNSCQDSGVESDIVWRQDMHELVLRLLRKRVQDEVEYIAVRGFLSRCATLDEVQWKKQVGFILWFGRPPDKHRDSAMCEADAGPTSYTTITTQHPTRKAAVYNLPRLLGHELTDALRHNVKLEPHSEAIVVKLRRSTVDTAMWLWKLEGYLEVFEEVQGTQKTGISS